MERLNLNMKYLYRLLLVLLVVSYSCNRKGAVEKVDGDSDTLQVATNRIANKLGAILIPSAKKELEQWKEYQDLDEFVLSYYNTSTIDALNNAVMLDSLVKATKDTIRIELLDKANVLARFNVLHNETLRLADMSTIPSITEEEVNEEVTKILELYSALNSKINTVYEDRELQESLEFDTETPVELDKDQEDINNKKKRP